MAFSDKLRAAQNRTNSWVCIGLDTDREKLPELLREAPDAVVTFNQAIIEACADIACAFKPNLAFYLSHGSTGIEMLKRTVRAIPPDVPIVLDAKFGDIDSSARGYARFAFGELDVDAVTVSPYLGADALAPFLEFSNRAIFVLAHTSNPGATQLQDQVVGDAPLYLQVARLVRGLGGRAEAGLVVGATFSEQIEAVRRVNSDAILLIPGVGSQGGSLEATVRFGSTSSGVGPLINASRSIIYASPGRNYAQAAREAAIKLRDEINTLRASE